MIVRRSLYLGWLFRVVAKPHTFGPRYFGALALSARLIRYGSEMRCCRLCQFPGARNRR